MFKLIFCIDILPYFLPKDLTRHEIKCKTI